MFELQVPSHKPESLRFRSAADGDYDRLVTESTVVLEGAAPRVVYQVLDAVPKDLIAAFRGIKYAKNARTEGLMTHSRVLGYQPRLPLRRDYCLPAVIAKQYPGAHNTFIRYAREATKIYRQFVPSACAEQEALLAKEVRSEWRIPETVFTSGIVNYNNPLRYHTDSGNFPGTWNAMYALTFDCLGGHLVLPEYRLAFSFHRPAFIIFPAQDVMHGVTPLRPRSTSAYRYSVVYYALRNMCKCLSPEAEVERIQKLKTSREQIRGGLKPRPAKDQKVLDDRRARFLAKKGQAKS